MTTWEIAIIVPYVTLLVMLAVFALHRLSLARAAARAPRVVEPPYPDRWPTVLIQLPIYNERYVASRLLDAVSRLRYPRDKLTVQVLDDSTDGSSSLVASLVRGLSRRGLQIEHIRRGDRVGYKAGALQAGLACSDAELVAIFDADFVPTRSFLRRLVPHFADTRVGMVQARWEHLNRFDSALTAAQAILLDGHFANEHGGRAARRCWFNFNGTAGVWRRRCIDDAGGWSGRTLTEDLDLSYRAQLKGWRFVYVPEVAVPAEIPADVDALKTQQHRWAKGAVETARLLLGEVWRAPVGLTVKLEASFHLLGNVAYPLVVLLALLIPAVMTVRIDHISWGVTALDVSLLLGSTGSLVFFYAAALRRVRAGVRAWLHLPTALAVGSALAINNTRALLEALLGRRSAFARTPKLAGLDPTQVDGAYLRANLRGWGQAVVETLLGVHVLSAVLISLAGGRWVAVPFITLFGAGFVVLGVGSLRRLRWLASGRASGKTLTAPPLPKRI